MADEQKKLKTGKEASVKGVIAALNGMEAELEREQERHERARLKVLEIIQLITKGVMVWYGFDSNNLLSTECCWVCGDEFEADLLVGCIGFYDSGGKCGTEDMICQRCLSDFDLPMGYMMRGELEAIKAEVLAGITESEKAKPLAPF